MVHGWFIGQKQTADSVRTCESEYWEVGALLGLFVESILTLLFSILATVPLLFDSEFVQYNYSQGHPI